MSDQELPPSSNEPPAEQSQTPEPSPSTPDPYQSAILGEPAPQQKAHISRSPIIALTVAVLVAALAAGTVVVVRSRSKAVHLSDRVPGDAAAYVEASIHPSGTQRDNLRNLLAKLPAAARTHVTSAIDTQLSKIASQAGLRYSTDVKPWLGDRVALAVVPPAAGGHAPLSVGLVAVKDETAARAALNKAKMGDTATEVGDGVAYFSDTKNSIDAFRAAVTTHGMLSATSAYTDATSSFGDALIAGWFDTKVLRGLGDTNGLNIPATFPDINGAFAFRVTGSGFELAGTSNSAKSFGIKGGVPKLLESSSAGLTASFTLYDVAGIYQAVRQQFGSLLERGLSTVAFHASAADPLAGALAPLGLDLDKDVLPFLHGEISVVMGGFSQPPIPDVGVLIQPTSSAAAARTLAKLRAVLEHQGVSVHSIAGGFAADVQGVEVPVIRSADRIIVASSAAYAATLMHAAPDQLGSDQVYQATFGSDSSGVVSQLFVRVDRVRGLLETFLPSGARTDYEANVKPYLDHIKAVGLRSTIDGTRGSFVLKVEVE